MKLVDILMVEMQPVEVNDKGNEEKRKNKAMICTLNFITLILCSTDKLQPRFVKDGRILMPASANKSLKVFQVIRHWSLSQNSYY